jgi:hypothetical protein
MRSPGVPGDRRHRAVVLVDRADLHQLDRLEGLDEIPGPEVVRLARADDLFGSIGVDDAERTFEQLAPVIALAAIVGQPLERRVVGREPRRHRLERDPHPTGVALRPSHSPMIVGSSSSL